MDVGAATLNETLQPANESWSARLPTYRIMTHESAESRIVKVGFSWPALLLNLIWLIANGLWLGAIVVSVLAFAMLALIESEIQESPVAVSAIAIASAIAILVFLGVRGNDWIASQLESRGYIMARMLEAENFAEAAKQAAADSHTA